MHHIQPSNQWQNNLSIPLKSWLYAEGSLTQQLTDLAQGQFQVELINEQYQRMQKQDAQWMNMPLHHLAWVRESYLYGCERQPWVKAKSIFPILSLRKKARIFPHIGKKPIGHYLFQRTQPECQRRVIYQDDGWTRQSCYTWHGCKFIVQETFLAQFEAFIQK
ncbi:chorismate lyase [Acinetobacter qingfengensis]|uniref:Probable chorismate pyruvate-lyase n=1 Tax=Acinetobacter qingfengensis TaxID=1262585 RepID=A0A1E7REI3_9GAMM|nr:chorismate lyase [Acinetobacter qingfengensis]KAA8735045.1 chorismate lyase [Acinetobacter qingfengensis]OEY97768.1 chorismate--pyruvate lyase [Acinetobacter qingfengensis]